MDAPLAANHGEATQRNIALPFGEPRQAPMPESTPRDGFVAFAEAEHGRLAMLGFVIGLGTELLTGQIILGQIRLV